MLLTKQGKESVKVTSPPPDLESKKDSDEEHTHRGKQIQKAMALISKTLKNIYKPTKNNLKTSSNNKNKYLDTSPRTGNDRLTGQYEYQRAVTVAENMETIGTQVVKQTGLQCFNCKGFGHFAKECISAKRVYHKEKMLLCKKEDFGI
nr:hypothetical protein [Tanacetum cinerariifolium]